MCEGAERMARSSWSATCFWQRRLARDAHAIGKPLILEGLSFTIVGVTPKEFLGLEVGQPFDVALPLAAEPLIRGKDSALLQPSSYLLFVMLRLKPSQSLQSATTLLRSLEPEIAPANVPQFLRPFALSPAAEGTSTPSGGAGGLRQRFRQPLFILMIVVGFVLLIACLNIAHLSMTRAVGRHREFAIRFALGASRWHVARQVLVENITVATAGTAIGVLFAAWASRVLVTTLSNPVREVVLDLSIDWHVVAFAAGITVVTALIFGIAPVLRASRPNVMEALKSESRQASSGGSQPVFGCAGRHADCGLVDARRRRRPARPDVRRAGASAAWIRPWSGPDRPSRFGALAPDRGARSILFDRAGRCRSRTFPASRRRRLRRGRR